MAGSVACVCVGADRLTEVTEVRWLTDTREVMGVSEVTVVETVWLALLLVSVSVQTDRLTEVTEVRWRMSAREVTGVSEVTVVETVWLAPLLVSVSVQTNGRK